MAKYSILISILVFLYSCKDSNIENTHLSYQNIIIFSDLSSRIENQPLKDFNEIQRIIQYFRNECVRPGKKMGDKSSISFATFSSKSIISIDLEKIQQIGERQQFINSTGRYKHNGLDFEIQQFYDKVASAYKNTRNQGLDLISMLIERIENDALIKKNTYLTDGIDTTFIKYNNQIYVFTDGYLEYVNQANNKQFHFGSTEIAKVRKFCMAKSFSVSKALELDKSLCLSPQKSNKNKDVDLHVLETHERDKNEKFQTYTHPIGLRDNEILQAVWHKWATESGFRSFEWKKY